MDDDRKDPLLRFPILMTDRLVLREITAEDAAFWLRNFSAPEVVELTAWEAPRDLEAAKAEIERVCTRPLGVEENVFNLSAAPDPAFEGDFSVVSTRSLLPLSAAGP